MKRPRAVRLNEHAVYYRGTGCVRVGGAVIELTVREEDLFELLLATPKVTVPWTRITAELGAAEQATRHCLKGLRDKLGTRAVRTHTALGLSLQPQWVGTQRFAIIRHPAGTLPARRGA